MKSKLERFANVPPQIRNSTLDQFIKLIKGITGDRTPPPPPPPDEKTAGMSPLIILALIGAGFAFFIKKK
jgi:hypothetical protein